MLVKGKRWIAALLTLVLLLSGIPTGARAQNAGDAQTKDAAIDLIWPCESAYRVTAAYYYKDGTTHRCSYGYKSGIDIGGGGNILAAEEGNVITVLDKGNTSYGKHIIIQHDNGMRTLYAHLASFGKFEGRTIQVGDRVPKGHILGVMGQSGGANGVHLHFEYQGGDPLKTVYAEKYANKLTYDANVRSNNAKYNSDKWIVDYLDQYYELKNDGYYHRKQLIPKPEKIVNVVSGVHVYWGALEGVTKYGLWRSETGVDGTYKWLCNPTTAHFTDTKVTTGKTYYYRITSMDSSGKHSDQSEPIGITYVATPDITKRENKAAGIALSWVRITGATGYAIYRKSYSGKDEWARVATISGNSTCTWTDTSVANNNGAIYKYTIRALAGDDMKTLSGCRAEGRTMVRLTARNISAADRTSFTSIKCTWSTTSKADGYEMRFMVGDSVYKTVTVGNYATGTKTFSGLKSGQTYKVQVRSYKKVADVGTFYSAWSQPKYVTLLSYELFLKQKDYMDDWNSGYRMGNPDSYCLIDIDQNGKDELIILSDTTTGFYDFLIYRMNAFGGISLVECYDGEYSVDSCYAGIRYSRKHKALVFSETRSSIMYGGVVYWSLEGTKLNAFASIGYEVNFNTNVKNYYTYFNQQSKTVSEATYNSHLNELTWLEFTPLP